MSIQSFNARFRMMRIREIALVAALTACAGPSAGGQNTPQATDPRARLHVYEVAPEQIAREAPQEAQEAFVVVSGSGSVSIPPDRVNVAFAMETRASTAGAASNRNAEAMDQVIRAVRDGGFAELELSTFGYSLRPEYSQRTNQNTRQIVAYVVLNNVRAVTADVDEAGSLIDAAIGAGANRVASLSFFASDTEAAEREALAMAVRDARAQAEVMAEALGHELGAPLEVRSGGGSGFMPQTTFEMADARAMQAVPTPIEVGDQTVTAQVTVRFALGPRMGG